MSLPEPELYVIYTGEGAAKRPKRMSLKKDFFGGRKVGVDCEVKILCNGKKGDIISQYVRFCHVFNGQVRKHGRTRRAVEETIRICRGENVLNDYLERQGEEVMDIMMSLFSEETMMRNHDAAVERRGRKEAAELINFLWSNGRGDDARRASHDEGFLEELLADFSAGKLMAN